MKGLTKRQREIVDFIQEFIATQNFSPSYREIMSHFGFSSLGSVYKHINVLKRKGLLAAEKNCSRSITPLEKNKERQTLLSIELPFMGYIAAGLPIEVFPETSTMAVPEMLVARPDKSYILQVRGDSMIDDQILDGDLVIVEARPKVAPGETVVALIRNHETTLKRYYPNGQYVRLEAANPHYKPIMVRQDEITIQGVLVGLMRTY